MKFYITLLGFLIFGVVGSFYIEHSFVKKSELLAIQDEAISNFRTELKILLNELDSVKDTAAKVRENNVQLQHQALQLKLESEQQATLEVARQSLIKIEAAQQALVKQRSECIVNQRNLQAAVRGYQNMKGLNVGDPIAFDELIGVGKLLSTMPACSSGKPYTLLKTIPPLGKLIATCNHRDEGGRHVPPKFADW